MCGIIGGISYTGEYFPDQNGLSSGAEYLKFRGPDDHGELLLERSTAKVAFAHRRLSIVDLTTNGRQPMTSVSGRSCIVFNGEIYNYKFLKQELEARKVAFRTQSDTEVILNAFEHWGIERALDKLDGMFAFALYDLETNQLILARDRFGKKPLYYFSRPGQLAFSSDIRSFSSIASIPKKIDFHALGYFFSELSTPHEHSIWMDVKKLKPGNFLKFDADGIQEYKPYWGIVYTENCTLKRPDLIERTEQLLSDAVKKRLVADVNVGAMLSGGIDSSLVVAKMAEQSSGRIKTYAVRFNDAEFDESPHSRYVAKLFDADHTEMVVEPNDLGDLSSLVGEFGEPFADVSMIPTYLVSKEISKHEKVVLGGDGGDELFAGYNSYYNAHKFDSVKNLKFLHPLVRKVQRIYPSYRTDFMLRLMMQAEQPRHHLLNRNMGFEGRELRRLSRDPRFYAALEHEHKFIWDTYAPHSRSDLINVMSASLKTRLLNDYLVKIDRASMYASLEMRSPFLDRDLIQFASTLHSGQLLHRNEPKSILKDIAKKYFKVDFIYRNKMGFGVPMGEWFRNDLKGNLTEIVLEGKQNLVDLDYGYIEEIITEHCSRKADHTHKLWALYVFHLWSNNQ